MRNLILIKILLLRLCVNIDTNDDKTIDKDEIAGFVKIFKKVGLEGEDEKISEQSSLLFFNI